MASRSAVGGRTSSWTSTSATSRVSANAPRIDAYLEGRELRIEAVPHAPHGLQMCGVRRICLYLGPQPANVHRDGVRIAVEVVSPHRLEELFAREHVPGISGEMKQQVELTSSHTHWQSVQCDRSPGGVQRNTAELDCLALRSWRAPT